MKKLNRRSLRNLINEEHRVLTEAATPDLLMTVISLLFGMGSIGVLLAHLMLDAHMQKGFTNEELELIKRTHEEQGPEASRRVAEEILASKGMEFNRFGVPRYKEYDYSDDY